MKILNQIESKLKAALSPDHLEVYNESHQHNVPKDAETHFKVVVVSEQFGTMGLVQRHRKVYELLSAELQGGVHALAIHAFTPKEFEARNSKAVPSPVCLGGSKE